MQKDAIKAAINEEKSNYIKAKLIISIGFDSSTDQAQYMQIFVELSTLEDLDASLVTRMNIPLRLLLSTENYFEIIALLNPQDFVD